MKKGEQLSSEIKEDEMPLDEEGKKFVTDSIEGKINPLRGTLDKVNKVIEANRNMLTTIQEKISTNPPATETEPKETRVDPKEVARRAIQMIREEDKAKRDEREQEEATKREREDLRQLVDFCIRNPESEKCKGKTLPDTVREILAEELKKREKPLAEEAGKKEGFGLSLPKKFEEMTPDEQVTIRTNIGEKIPHPVLLGILEECAKSDDPERCDLVKAISKAFPEDMTKELTEEAKKTVTVSVCKDNECKPVQVSLKEDGIAFLVKTDKGWEPADEEIKKQLTDEVNKKIQEELEKRPGI